MTTDIHVKKDPGHKLPGGTRKTRRDNPALNRPVSAEIRSTELGGSSFLYAKKISEASIGFQKTS